MNQTLIQRYQSGGDIYNSIALAHGTGAADAAAAAALTGDETQVNAVLAQYATAAGNSTTATPNLPTSTLGIFGNQLATDPLAAPLASANNLLSNSFLAFLKNPAVLLTVLGIAFFLFGGGELIRGWIKRKANA